MGLDLVLMDEVCGAIHNWFSGTTDARRGSFRVEGGTLAGVTMGEGQLFRIAGSAFNDGVYRWPAEGLRDEVFDGTVQLMRPPAAFLRLIGEIEAWRERYGAAEASPYQSENVAGVYSYTRAAGRNTEDGDAGWMAAFKGRLRRWRRLA